MCEIFFLVKISDPKNAIFCVMSSIQIYLVTRPVIQLSHMPKKIKIKKHYFGEISLYIFEGEKY
jgi:hypothetical protein